MKIKTVSIDDDVAAVLKAAKLEGNNLALQGQLNPAMYKRVMKILELIGFKWNRSAKCHIGEGDAAEKLSQALNAGTCVDEKKTFQFFETPQKLCERLVTLSDITPSHTVLEPSAGKGAIVKAILADCPDVVVRVCEINDAMRTELAHMGSVDVVAQDFLAHHDKYDRIVMNPPFTGGQDIEHVLHAYSLLNPGGRLVAITSKGWTFNETKRMVSFREWHHKLQEEGLAEDPEEIPSGAFKQSGTDVGTLLLVISKPGE